MKTKSLMPNRFLYWVFFMFWLTIVFILSLSKPTFSLFECLLLFELGTIGLMLANYILDVTK